MQSTLGEFRETETGQAFTKQNSKLLKVELNQITIQAKLGSMVAYQGDCASSMRARAACPSSSRRR